MVLATIGFVERLGARPTRKISSVTSPGHAGELSISEFRPTAWSRPTTWSWFALAWSWWAVFRGTHGWFNVPRNPALWPGGCVWKTRRRAWCARELPRSVGSPATPTEYSHAGVAGVRVARR